EQPPQADDAAGPARILALRIRERLARLRGPLGARRQLVRAQELAQGLKRRQPSRAPVTLAPEPGGERRGILAKLWQLAEPEPSLLDQPPLARAPVQVPEVRVDVFGALRGYVVADERVLPPVHDNAR